MTAIDEEFRKTLDEMVPQIEAAGKVGCLVIP